MTAEKGAEQPLDKYVRFKNNIKLWYKDMTEFGLDYDRLYFCDQEVMDEYFFYNHVETK